MNNLEILDKLMKNYVLDQKKSEINVFERAQIIRSILEKEEISVRTFATKYGLNRSTVEDWLMYNRIDEQEYRRLRDKGISMTAIYANLREKKTEAPSKSEIDFFLQEIKVKAKHYRNDEVNGTPRTMLLIEESIQELKQLATALIIKQKKGLK